MSPECAIHDHLACLFAYPVEGHGERMEACREAVSREYPEAAEHLASLAERTSDLTLEGKQELFSKTFELNPVCSAEVGWHLFAENYERGTFMVWMRAQLREFGLRESTELPDHLTHVLPALGRMAKADAEEFSATCVLPALDRMLASLKDKDNPNEDALRAVRSVLVARHGEARPGSLPLPIVQQYGDSLILLDGR